MKIGTIYIRQAKVLFDDELHGSQVSDKIAAIRLLARDCLSNSGRSNPARPILLPYQSGCD